MILQNSIALGGSSAPAAYQIERSLRFNSADSAYLSWTPPQAGNRRTWTWSGWVKRSSISTEQALFACYTATDVYTCIRFLSGATLQIVQDNGAGVQWNLTTSAVYRDASAFYHVLVAVDTTQATAADRVKLYINGVQVTAFSTSSYPSQNFDTQINRAQSHTLGFMTASGYLSGYLTEVNFIDGQALTPSDFGETSSSTGVWIPKAYTGSYGQNGFYLPFNDNSTVLNLGRNRQTLTADPYFPYTTLLLNGNGTNGAQNNTFLDSSSNNFTITRNGNTTQGTFSPFSQTGWSNFFPNTYLSAAANNAFSFGTGNFTVEAWVYPTVGSVYRGIFANGGASTGSFAVYLTNTNTVRLDYYGGGGLGTTTTVALNTWSHIVVARSGSTISIFINGTREATTTTSDNNTSNACYIGASWGGASDYMQGYMSNLRVVKGTAVYDPTLTTLTVPTAALTAVSGTSLLTCQSNRFIDNSTNAFAITVNGTPSVQPFSPFTPTAAYSAATNGGSGYFDGTGDYLGGGSQTAYAFGTGTFTVEAWVYVTSRAAEYNIAATRASAGTTAGWSFAVNTSGGITFYTDSFVFNTSNQVPLNAWTHIAVTREGTGTNQTKLYINGVNTNSTTNAQNFSNTTLAVGCNNDGSQFPFFGYISGFRALKGTALTSFTLTAPPTAITNTSLLLNFTNAGIIDATGDNVLETVGNAQISTTQSKWGGSSMYFDGTGDYLLLQGGQNFTFGTGDFTIEFWVYVNSGLNTDIVYYDGRPASTNGLYNIIYSNSTGKLVYNTNSADRITGTTTLSTGTWYHVALSRSGTSTKLFLNGTQEGSTYTDSNSYIIGTNRPVIGGNGFTLGNAPLNGYIDDVRVSKFARYTGNFTVPAAQFAFNTADINVKQWVPNNFSVTAGVGNDSLVDSPTNYGTDTGAGGEVRGNYATLNPLQNAALTLANGNLDATGSAATWRSTTGTLAQRTGKFYYEVTVTATTATNYMIIGVARAPVAQADMNNAPGALNANSWGIQFGSPSWKVNNGYTALGSSYSYTTNDVLMVAVDVDAGRFWFGKNGTWIESGNPATGANPIFTNLTGEIIPMVGVYDSGNTGACNFGQRPFAYTAPSGFKALCTQNLPTPAIGASASTLANKNFDIALYTGNGSARSITGLGFQPDFVWIKSRSNLNWWHQLQDAVRGATKRLASNDTAAEATDATTLTAFNSDGFSLGTSTSYNNNSDTYVAWNWKANGAGSSNTAGSITSTVSANTTAGISVVTYTGTGTLGTVGHGLAAAPAMIIIKRRNGAADWDVYHRSIGNGQYISLNLTNAAASSAWLNNTSPSSTVFTLNGGSFTANTSGATLVAYCFAEVAGFSRFGSYTGNGSADGPFIFTGFRPRFVLIKSSSDGTAGNDWAIIDAARNTFNESAKFLRPNLSAAEGDDAGTSPAISIDILSNGFKVRGTSARINTSSSTYIFAAFGESPFNYSRAR